MVIACLGHPDSATNRRKRERLRARPRVGPSTKDRQVHSLQVDRTDARGSGRVSAIIAAGERRVLVPGQTPIRSFHHNPTVRRLVSDWMAKISLNPLLGTHSHRRTKAALIIKGTVRYLGVEVADAFNIAEHLEV